MAVWRNTPSQFGLATKILHWLHGILILGLVGLGFYLINAQIGLHNLHLFGWHKSLGLVALFLGVLRLVWRWYTPPPAPIIPKTPTAKIAKAVHHLLYILIFVMPVSGWIASSASGFPMSFFDTFPIPAIAPVSEGWESVFFTLHWLSALLLCSLIALHIAGAIWHQMVKRDATMSRMWFGRPN